MISGNIGVRAKYVAVSVISSVIGRILMFAVGSFVVDLLLIILLYMLDRRDGELVP